MGMLFGGFFFAFIMGWKFAFVCLGIIPLIFVSMSILQIVQKCAYRSKSKAFKESSGLAEQAFTAIKVIASLGQEEKEIARFQ